MEDKGYLRTDSLSVGYDKKTVTEDIAIHLKKGEIMTLIGPNGCGKSTILKTIAKELVPLKGRVFIDNANLEELPLKETAKKMSVVMTGGPKLEYSTCKDIVEAGRYPYTGSLGILSEKDHEKVLEAIELVKAKDIADKYFLKVSDGQRQRILLARALCQEPELIVLDEPTSYLDIHYKLELLDILKKLVKDRNIAVLMSMHELELAAKVSDWIVGIKDGIVKKWGRPKEVLTKKNVMELFDLSQEGFKAVFSSYGFFDSLKDTSKDSKNNSEFFSNPGCRYYPCHGELKERDFNCLFCYCPLYNYDNCPGNPKFITKDNNRQIKDCTYCTFPHRWENYSRIIDFLKGNTHIKQ